MRLLIWCWVRTWIGGDVYKVEVVLKTGGRDELGDGGEGVGRFGVYGGDRVGKFPEGGGGGGGRRGLFLVGEMGV